MSRKNDKRSKLVDAADELFYHKAYSSTTLADIACKSGVPLGNVYYYFKTKDEILMAVTKKRETEYEATFSTWNQLPTAKERLKAFIAQYLDNAEASAHFGCALGGLCQELSKLEDSIAALSSALMHKTLQWVEKQFTDLGKGSEASKLAEYLIANLEGVSLLTLTFKDPSYLQRSSASLDQWLNTV